MTNTFSWLKYELADRSYVSSLKYSKYVQFSSHLEDVRNFNRTSKSFYRLLVMDFNSWICKIMLRSRVMPSFAYLECHCSLFRRACSQTCLPSVATLL